MTTQHRRVITKIAVSAAIALGSIVGAAAPANADSNAVGGAGPNPFGGLSCSCQKTTPPAGSPAAGIEAGIREGLAARVPGLPPPPQPGQPRRN
ncbi:hypothetical protein BST25_14545 [Mycobacterium heidelbergense]|uniref:Uncharacterized protein n=1 Tax=Mycobacterium heidelbergense TaxID=53376 RepID=A0A1X0DJ94_MYCHE|nr:hypothetical protein BST25_14545 [Mycobacterium heidelbergense]